MGETLSESCAERIRKWFVLIVLDGGSFFSLHHQSFQLLNIGNIAGNMVGGISQNPDLVVVPVLRADLPGKVQNGNGFVRADVAEKSRFPVKQKGEQRFHKIIRFHVTAYRAAVSPNENRTILLAIPQKVPRGIVKIPRKIAPDKAEATGDHHILSRFRTKLLRLQLCLPVFRNRLAGKLFRKAFHLRRLDPVDRSGADEEKSSGSAERGILQRTL